MCPYVPVDLRLSGKADKMASRACMTVVVVVGLFLLSQTSVPAAALRRAVDELAADERAYARGLEYGPRYELQPGELPELIVDYANMIRNDIILLDNSVETRTRKRGNIKLEKHTNQALSDVPCNCERNDPRTVNVNLSMALGTDVYPEVIQNVTCDETKCAKPYRCRKIIYDVVVLKRTDSHVERLKADDLYREMHNELKRKWVPRRVPVVAGCLCAAEYVAR